MRLEGVADRVVLNEGVSENEKIDQQSNSKFFIRFELGKIGTSCGTVEAMKCGTPVIVNGELGISDYLKEYLSSLIVSDASKIEEIKRFIESNDNLISYSNLQEEIMRMTKDESWKNHCESLLGMVSRKELENLHRQLGGLND